MAKAIPTSKRSIIKRSIKELRKLLPGMAIYVRRTVGELHVWHEVNEVWTHESWWLFIGDRHWTKEQCQREGHVIWSVRPDLVKVVMEDLKVYQSIPKGYYHAD